MSPPPLDYKSPSTKHVKSNERQFPIEPVLKWVFIVIFLTLIGVGVVFMFPLDHIQKINP
jgi:hypothetical protein